MRCFILVLVCIRGLAFAQDMDCEGLKTAIDVAFAEAEGYRATTTVYRGESELMFDEISYTRAPDGGFQKQVLTSRRSPLLGGGAEVEEERDAGENAFSFNVNCAEASVTEVGDGFELMNPNADLPGSPVTSWTVRLEPFGRRLVPVSMIGRFETRMLLFSFRGSFENRFMDWSFPLEYVSPGER